MSADGGAFSPGVPVGREELAAGYRALREGRGATRIPWEALVVSGPDAASYLQGQLSQDVEHLEVGGSLLSLVLEPQGKLDALVRVTRTAPDAFLLDLKHGFLEALRTRLERFRLRTKVSFAELQGLELVAIPFARPPVAGEQPGGTGGAPHALEGPALETRALNGRGSEGFIPEGLGAAPGEPGTLGRDGEGPLRLPRLWPALGGVDLLARAGTAALPEGVAPVPPEAFEALRIEAGLPSMGRELTERTIPAEAGVVEVAVSFTKGCYTGQELVARIDARGSHVPRRLRGVLLGDGPQPPVGAELVSEGRVVGALTSVAWSPVHGVVGLGYVGRAVEPPATVEVRAAGLALRGEVRALPLGG
jgi:folate-binding protein YgfZ